MRRFFTEPDNVDRDGSILTITEDAAHISRVLRMDIGDKILVFDGGGLEYEAEISGFSEHAVAARILSMRPCASEPETKVTLFQGVPKSDKLDTIVQKAVELGAVRIVPVNTARSVARISSDTKGRRKIERLNKISKEAAKQCGRGTVPTVDMPISFSDLPKLLEENELNIMFYEELGHIGEKNLRQILSGGEKRIGIIIGPEGGFSIEEAECLKNLGGVAFAGLGKRILRTETAGLAALSIIMYEKNEI